MVVVTKCIFKVKICPSKKKNFYFKEIMGTDPRGVNAMSISEITNIPRPTVVRKLKFLIDNNWLEINEKKLIRLND
jgi:DNA-binding IclR family transcriptional regulator